MRDAHGLLLRAIGRWAGPRARIGATRSEPWSSATFTGARHRIVLATAGAGAGETADRLAAELPRIELNLPGHLLADLAVAARAERANAVDLTIEALTVEAA